MRLNKKKGKAVFPVLSESLLEKRSAVILAVIHHHGCFAQYKFRQSLTPWLQSWACIPLIMSCQGLVMVPDKDFVLICAFMQNLDRQAISLIVASS